MAEAVTESNNPQNNSQPLITIVGNGIAGVTAARTARKLNSHARIQLISDETDYFFSRTALMYIYMGHMRFEDTMPYQKEFWEKCLAGIKKNYTIQQLKTWIDPISVKALKINETSIELILIPLL